MDAIEKRQHPRFAVALKCTISDGDRQLTGATENVSRGGVSMMLEAPIELSSVVVLEMALDFGNDSFSEPLNVQALIVWCTRLGERWQVGAKFSNLTREQRTYLEMFLHYLDSSRDTDDNESPARRRRT